MHTTGLTKPRQRTRSRNQRGEGGRLRGEIIDSAVKILAGLEPDAPFSLRAVAKEAQIAPPSVYIQFADRDVLLLAVLERLFDEEKIRGENLLSFGDGPVEIAATKQLGGLAIAVCSDEDHNGSGVMDPFKRRLLLDSGADAAIPDFRDANALVDHLLTK